MDCKSRQTVNLFPDAVGIFLKLAGSKVATADVTLLNSTLAPPSNLTVSISMSVPAQVVPPDKQTRLTNIKMCNLRFCQARVGAPNTNHKLRILRDLKGTIRNL